VETEFAQQRDLGPQDLGNAAAIGCGTDIEHSKAAQIGRELVANSHGVGTALGT
jgi:hypothetical protein